MKWYLHLLYPSIYNGQDGKTYTTQNNKYGIYVNVNELKYIETIVLFKIGNWLFKL